MDRENRPLVTNELVEFEKLQVEVLEFKILTHHFRGICGITSNQ